jgi:signal transduction histidine kinase/ligand-binding sensor domain-containing protein
VKCVGVTYEVTAIMLRRLLFVFVLLWLRPTPAWAVDPTKRITQYAHAAWRWQDGAISSVPFTIVQTPDGYIWIGTASGIFQFDGVRFVPWNPGGGQVLPRSFGILLTTTRDGSVWISGEGTLSRWKDHRLTNFAREANVSFSVAEDPGGKVWVARRHASGIGPHICQAVNTSLQCLDPADGAPVFHPSGLVTDREGTLWVAGDTGLLRWAQGASTVYRPPVGTLIAGMQGVKALAATSDGTLWVGFAKAAPGQGLVRIIDGRWQSFDTPTLRGSSLSANALHVDRHGALWVGTPFSGIYRIVGNVVEHFDHTNGLSDDSVADVTEDREGNIWVATAKGVDRFADAPINSLSVSDGLCGPNVQSVLASRDGSIWIGGTGTLTRLRDSGVTCFREGGALPGGQVTSLFEDQAGRLWVGIEQSLWVYEGGRFLKVHRQDDQPIGSVSGIAQDVDGHMWISVFGPPRTLMRVDGLVAQRAEAAPAMPRRIAADGAGGLWLGQGSGDLAYFRKGQTVVHEFEHPAGARINQVLMDADGSVIAATSYGLIGWRDGKALTLTSKNGLPCEMIYGMVFDRRHDLWLFMNCALGVIKNADLLSWKQKPEIAVSMRTFGGLDGVFPIGASFSPAARSPDGRLWFANGTSLQVVDPERIPRNTLPPPVYIEQVVADRKLYGAEGVLQLPALTRDLQIDYVGLSFVAPQKVRFRYRLDGRDDTWQEPGTRRQAFYTDLRPGTYRFRVIASNNDGVWNEEGASLSIVVAPAWYQTQTFLMLSIVSAALAVWAAYRLRLRQVAHALNTRFDERLVERTRMARDLHDTLLQTLQGTKMVADTALDRPDDAPTLARALRQVSAWVGQASEEGRSAVNALRTSTTEGNDLAEAFRRAIEDGQRKSTIGASIVVTGSPREMHPVVRDEVYRIGYEAIRNAYTHSHATRLEIALSYGRDLTLRVADDGVGMEATTAERGKEGHFGMPGMRERASRIGATLSVASTPGAGTAIVVAVPGRAIFRKAPTRLAERLRSMFSGTEKRSSPY